MMTPRAADTAMRFSTLFLVLLSPVSVDAQEFEKPRLVPLFSNVEQAPAFMVECVNTSAAPISAMELIQEVAIKVDGKLFERTGGIAGSFLGGEPLFVPSERWRMMVGLRQGLIGTMSANFGAVLRTPWVLPLTAGRHSVAVRCVGNWSDEVEFWWESAVVPK